MYYQCNLLKKNNGSQHLSGTALHNWLILPVSRPNYGLSEYRGRHLHLVMIYRRWCLCFILLCTDCFIMVCTSIESLILICWSDYILVHYFFQMLLQKQDSEQELSMKIEKLQAERSSLQERVQALQRALATLETEKRESEREQIRLEKDKSALQKTLDKVCISLFDVLIQISWSAQVLWYEKIKLRN